MIESNKLYDFVLPENLIAQSPATPRDSAKLLVYSLADGSITDSTFKELDKFLATNTTLILNNSKVEECRWLFDKNKTEIFVLEKIDSYTVRAIVRPGRKFKLGKAINLTDWLSALVTAVDTEGIRTMKLNIRHDNSRLKKYEHIPLPPYIAQDDSLADEYQTVFAKPVGSLAAPTAGLHFTCELLKEISQKHNIAELTLHVGLGTFAKLTMENLKSGRLHSESYRLTDSSLQKIQSASHITAVGTTSVRTLESVFKAESPKLKADGSTDIFIRPGHKFCKVDSMITNFHLPSTSLLMLVAAFIADKKSINEKQAAEELMRIYNHAIEQKYRFYSFGDAMLLV
ncbi:MAG: tRNA preQ1(34) S-adenosylmethionine ribosyltransferase-isomerase QueA [bacterium]|nr:tRNA preQ1(34) S-adenosylmethionine ribosyltransferase-isomerase QueA [bacterium]